MFEIKPLRRIQHDYRELLRGYEDEIRKKDISDFRLKVLFEEVKIFWFKNREYVSFLLNNIEYSDDVAFLAGAVYVDIANDGHIDFSLLGRKRIINDPLTKMSNFFIVDTLPFDYSRIKNYVYCVGTDLIDLLDNFSCDFFVIPLGNIDNKIEIQRLKDLSTLAETCLLAAFDYKYGALENMADENNTFEDIERNLNKDVLSALVYMSTDDAKLSLRERIEQYCEDMMDYQTLKEKQTEHEIFIIVTNQNIMQCLDIFIIASEYKMVPFIRNDVVFCYLAFLLNAIERIVSSEILNKCIIAYIAQKKYEFNSTSYSEFIKEIGNGQLVNQVLMALKDGNRLFPVSSLADIAVVLDEKYSPYNM
jgi:hypothetical protein